MDPMPPLGPLPFAELAESTQHMVEDLVRSLIAIGDEIHDLVGYPQATFQTFLLLHDFLPPQLHHVRPLELNIEGGTLVEHDGVELCPRNIGINDMDPSNLSGREARILAGWMLRRALEGKEKCNVYFCVAFFDTS